MIKREFMKRVSPHDSNLGTGRDRQQYGRGKINSRVTGWQSRHIKEYTAIWYRKHSVQGQSGRARGREQDHREAIMYSKWVVNDSHFGHPAQPRWREINAGWSAEGCSWFLG